MARVARGSRVWAGLGAELLPPPEDGGIYQVRVSAAAKDGNKNMQPHVWPNPEREASVQHGVQLPALPNTDPYPVAPAILIHWLLDPGDHFDDSSMLLERLLERLPKKLHTSIEEDAQRTPRVPPVGWGIYIVDEIN
ncbi:hypothetical protein GGTG_11116 [Gaeumannomyces tritici R3-111a-1]|uniref:Uncharacterized protein n=1 Tax=Gaeumannomyces tritici (strain R3-111a-1) TaxID=644352 RepID=J3PC93_GAET3|nr:hypothetical protein GGTG_11116 [Gaeumannomyces tritici R3-111a-1]EJT71863.1 hypothetical protein GGTG_11116 [Gaeumannomyces tritici R3-111a-1]